MPERWAQERLVEPESVTEVRNLPWRDLTEATVVEHRMLAEVRPC